MEEEEEQYREYQHKKQLPKKGPIPVEKKKKKSKKTNKKSVSNWNKLDKNINGYNKLNQVAFIDQILATLVW